ncbi:hypothetical protein RQP46_010636 [Phenoliferia psychrophenolica]
MQPTSPVILLLATLSFLASEASAALLVDPFEGVEKTCLYHKIHDLATSVLLVYLSNILTIRLDPGAGTRDTISDYILGAFLPLATCRNSCWDLQFRIGAPAGDQLWRRTDARLFVPIDTPGDGAVGSAFAGIFNVTLSTIQLFVLDTAVVTKFGYGAYIFTLLPYAVSALINTLAAITTPKYPSMILLTPKPFSQWKEHSGVGKSNPAPLVLHSIVAGFTLIFYITYVLSVTGAHGGESTILQRIFLLAWPIAGIAFGADEWAALFVLEFVVGLLKVFYVGTYSGLA